jgi:protocatechuate 3,4-dioxygenase beta subunit
MAERSRLRPWPQGIQPDVPVPHYPNTWTHTPAQALLRRPITRTEATGPMDLARKLPCGDHNLAVMAPGRMAQGQLIQVSGRVLDDDGRPVRNAIVELWQANAAGRYRHPLDQREAPLDPDFAGKGRVRTDDDGNYCFMTIKPGAYPVSTQHVWWRPPHIHFSVLGLSTSSRLVTQMYFPGDPLNAFDHILLSVPDPQARERLIARQVAPAEGGNRWLAYQHDIVIRGPYATPMDA